METIRELMQGRTTLIRNPPAGHITISDQIIVLERGRIAEQGPRFGAGGARAAVYGENLRPRQNIHHDNVQADPACGRRLVAAAGPGKCGIRRRIYCEARTIFRHLRSTKPARGRNRRPCFLLRWLLVFGRENGR